MNLLLISPAPGLSGGISRWSEHILNYYKKERPVDICMFFLPVEVKGSPHTGLFGLFNRVIRGAKLYLGLLQKVKKMMKEQEIEVVHLCSSGSIGFLRDVLLIRIAHKLGVKVIVHTHFGRIPDLLNNVNWESRLLMSIIMCADGIITIDQSSHIAIEKVPTFSNVVNIPNPLAPEVLNTFEKIEPMTKIKRRLLFVGQTLRTKGVIELVNACSMMDDIELIMIGSLPHKGVLGEIYQIAGEKNNWLTIMGEQSYDTILREMSKCDLFVLPTYTEGFPNVILEAMACGCAIVSTGVGAITEMLNIDSESPCGMLVDSRSVESLKVGILSLLDNEELKEIYRFRAKKRVRDCYNINTVWAQMSDFWNTVTLKK